VAVVDREFFAKAWDFGAKMAWGAVTGEGDTAAAAAGDLSLSLIPVVGVVTDVRDMGKELLKLWPGGEGPNWWFFGFAAAGIVAEFTPTDWVLDVGKAVLKRLRPGGAMLMGFIRVIKEFSVARLEEFEDFFRHLMTPSGLQFAGVADLHYVIGPDDLDRLNILAKRFTPDEIDQALTGYVADLSPKGAKRAFDLISGLTEAQHDILRLHNKLDVVAKGVAKASWGQAITKSYVEQVARLGGDNPLVQNFDEFAHVPGSGSLVMRKLDDADGAVQAELAVAKKFEGETVERFAAKPVGGFDGDIDVVTSVRAYEVKAGNPLNLIKDRRDRDKFRLQLQKLADYANANGKTPVIAFKQAYLPLPQEVSGIIDEFGMTVEGF
jgi:hypothetical protein